MMVVMVSKNISSCTVSYTALSMKTDSHFQPIQNLQQSSIQLFFVFFKRYETVLHWHNFFQDVPHIQKTFKYTKTDTYTFDGP